MLEMYISCRETEQADKTKTSISQLLADLHFCEAVLKKGLITEFQKYQYLWPCATIIIFAHY